MGGSSSKHHRNDIPRKKCNDDQKISTNSNGKEISKSKRKKEYLKQIKHDKKFHRVTKNQLHRLSFDLKRTPWYLGRRLGFREKEVQILLTKYASNQETIRHILFTWRKRNGWQATTQKLVILLELAGYDYEEYKVVLQENENGDLNIYNKAPYSKQSSKQLSHGSFRYDNYDVRSNFNLKVPDVNEHDIVKFARRSWKQPRRKERKHSEMTSESTKRADDSGFATSPDQSVSDKSGQIIESRSRPSTSSSVTPTTDSNLHVVRCSDSTFLNKGQSLPENDSESELCAIFGPQKIDDIIATPRIDTVIPKDAVKKSSSLMANVHHERHESTDSQLENYKNQIARMSQRRYDPIYRSKSTTEGKQKGKNKEMSSSFCNFFKFQCQEKNSNEVKGQVSGIDITPDDDIIVSDSGNKRIQTFDKFGNFQRSFNTRSELNPKGVFLTPQQEIAVCCGCEVRMFSIDGNVNMTFGQGTFRNNCYSILCDPMGSFYVTDIVSHTVSVYDNKGNIRKRFGYHGSTLMNFDQPVALAISEKNELFISDSQNHCVKVYSLAGRPLYAIGEKGTEDGKFWNPFGLCFDKHGYLYVADCGNNRISVFDVKREFYRHALTNEDGIRMPTFIKINSSGQLIVAEWKSPEVKVFSFETAV